MSAPLTARNKDWLPYPWQLDIWEHINQLKQEDRLPHALLVHGEKGGGKKNLVDGLAKKLLCRQGGEFACGECKSCTLFSAGTHPDFVDIGLEEKAKQLKVDQIRAVVNFITKTSQMNGIKIVVIEPAEAMNINSANALLKCLEEPAGDTLIVLISHAPNRLLPTIRSRCQSIVLPKPTQEIAETWLATFVNDISQRKKLLSLANGNPLLALAYWEDDVLSLYNDSIDKLIGIKSGQFSIIKTAEELQKKDVQLWLDINQKILWQLLRASLSGASLQSINLELFEAVVQKKGFNQRAYKVLEVLQAGIRELQGPSNPNPQLLLETLLMHWQALLRSGS